MVERVLSAASAAYDVVMGAEEPCVHWSGWILGQKYSLPNGNTPCLVIGFH